MGAFDAGRILATADLDRTPFIAGLEEAKRKGREFANEKYAPKIGADTGDGDAKVYDFKSKLERLSAQRVTPTLTVDNAAGLVKLVDFNERLDQLRRKVATARADVDDAKAREKLDALDIRLRRVGTITSRPRVTVEGVERANLQLDDLALKLAGINAAGGGGRGRLTGRGGGFGSGLPRGPGMLGLLLGGALPLAGPLAGVGLGAGASFLTPTLAGGIGLGAFGAGAAASIRTVSKDVEKLTQLSQRYDAAVTNKQRAAVLRQEHMLWASLDPAQRQAVKNVDALDESWKRYQKALQPQTFAALATGATIAQQGLKLILPVAKQVGDAVNYLESEASGALQQPFWHHFFHDVLTVEAPLAVNTLGTVVGNVVTGIAHLTERFRPLGHDLESLLVQASDRFEQWTEGKGPGKFVRFMEKEGPVVGRDLDSLAHGISGVVKGLSPIGQIELKALGPVLNFIGDLGDQHPAVITALGAAYLSVAGGLKAVAAVRGLSSIASVLSGDRIGSRPGGGGVGGVLGGISKAEPVPVYVTNWHGGGIPGVSGGPGGPPEEERGPGGLRKVGGALTSVGGPVAVIGGLLYLTASAPSQGPVHRVGNVVETQDNKPALMGPRTGMLPFNQIGPDGTDLAKNTSQTDALSRAQEKQARNAKSAADSQNALNKLLGVGVKASDDAKGGTERLLATVSHVPGLMRNASGSMDTFTGALHKAGAGAETAGENIGSDLGHGLVIALQKQLSAATVQAKIGVQQLIKHIRYDQNGVWAGSPSRNTMPAGKDMADGLLVGWLRRLRDAQPAFNKGALDTIHGFENSAARYVARTAQKLADARNQLSSDLGARGSLIGTITGAARGYANLAGAVNPNGSVGSVTGFLRSRLSKLRQFFGDLKRLDHKGLAPGLLREIAELGVDGGGLALAQSVLADPSQIGTVDRLQRQINSYARQTGQFVGHTLFDSRIASDRSDVAHLAHVLHEQRHDLHQILEAIKKNPAAFAHALEQAFRGAHVQSGAA